LSQPKSDVKVAWNTKNRSRYACQK